MILILAQNYELNVNYVGEILDHYGVSWFRLNGEDIPLHTRMHLELSDRYPSGSMADGEGRRIALSDIRAVWSRRHGEFELGEALTIGQKRFIQKECSHALLGFYSLLDHACWMNDYFLELKAVNKLYQLQVARSCGLKIPPTLVTQDPDHASAFQARHKGSVLCKAISQSGHVPQDDTRPGRVIYANRIESDPEPDFERVQFAPTLFQGYVDKEYELRVTIVGNAIFSAAIESQRSERTRVDWRRYDTAQTPYYPYRLPSEVEQCLLQLMRKLGLEYGAVDLIRDKDGAYVFLEVNPGGQWGWVEGLTGHPINEAIAKWLITRSGNA